MEVACCPSAISAPLRVECVYGIIDTHPAHAMDIASAVANSESIDEQYRAKTVMKLARGYPVISANLAHTFILKHKEYAVVVAQTVLTSLSADSIVIDSIQHHLMHVIATADAYDTLLSLGTTPEIKEHARSALDKLGGGSDVFHQNAENVHFRSVQTSVADSMRIIYEKARAANTNETPFNVICAEITASIKDASLLESVTRALSRIDMDAITYSNGQTLKDALCNLWRAYVSPLPENHEMRQLIVQRLCQELAEMQATCSSGYAARLVNALSGLGLGVDVRISFSEQLASAFTARMNARMKLLSDENLDALLEQLLIDTKRISERGLLLAFMRDNVCAVRDELYAEYFPKEAGPDDGYDMDEFNEAMITCFSAYNI